MSLKDNCRCREIDSTWSPYSVGHLRGCPAYIPGLSELAAEAQPVPAAGPERRSNLFDRPQARPAAAGGEGRTPLIWDADNEAIRYGEDAVAFVAHSYRDQGPLIVEAVNSHHDLVEALRTISQGRKANEGRSEDALERIIGVARAALKKAGLL